MPFTAAGRPKGGWVGEGDQVTLRQLTDSIGRDVEPTVVVETASETDRGADGREISALLYVPHAEAVQSAVTPGAVLYLQDRADELLKRWEPTAQLLANRGLVVLSIAARDPRDVVAGADWLAGEGIADPARIGIHGDAALDVLARHPERFAAAVAGSSTAIPQRLNIRGALLVLQGENDDRVPAGAPKRPLRSRRASGAPRPSHGYAGEGRTFATTEDRTHAIPRAGGLPPKDPPPPHERHPTPL